MKHKIKSFFTKELTPIESAPRGYGYGRRDYRRNIYYCHPLPFNIIFVWYDSFMCWLIKPRFDKKLHEAWNCGYEEGSERWYREAESWKRSYLGLKERRSK